MADIYNNAPTTSIAKFIKHSEMELKIGGNTTGETCLVQNIQISYSQGSQTVYEIGSPKYYKTKTPAQGQCTIQYFFSDKKLTDLFPSNFFTGFTEAGSSENKITLKATGNGQNFGYELGQCVITSIGAQIQAEAPYIQGNVQIQFSTMSKIK